MRKEALDKLNRLAATMITPVCRSTRVKTMEILYDLIPLHLFIQKKAIASLSRNRHCMILDWSGKNPKCKTYIGHLKYWGYKLQEINVEIDNTGYYQVFRINSMILMLTISQTPSYQFKVKLIFTQMAVRQKLT